jgi:cysteine synthase A
MINDALQKGLINSDTIIIEPTSGNTGIGLAGVCASMGLKLTLTMPESMSVERRTLLKALGANIVLTPASEGMKGAINKANELVQSTPNAIILQQFENMANVQMHINTTAQEILRDTDGKIDIFVASVGTGGTLTGVAKVLKEYNKNIKIVAVEPKQSPVLSGGNPSPHKIQGIGAGFVPKILDISLIDEIIQVDENDAIATSKQLAKTEGLLVGISAGANVYASHIIAQKETNKTIITILCDTGERYLSTTLYQD